MERTQSLCPRKKGIRKIKRPETQYIYIREPYCGPCDNQKKMNDKLKDTKIGSGIL